MTRIVPRLYLLAVLWTLVAYLSGDGVAVVPFFVLAAAHWVGAAICAALLCREAQP
jgi:hypothetical protein